MILNDNIRRIQVMYLDRSPTSRLHALMKSFPALVVTGARQVGKSTLLLHALSKRADFVVFDPVFDVENARQDPDLFLNNHRTPLVLDEVQYAPELVAAVKRRIDRMRKPGQFVLTGSQQWGVLQSIAESLAGRAAFLDLEGLSLAEIAEEPTPSWLDAWLQSPSQFIKKRPKRLDLKIPLWEQLWRGWLPEAQFLPRELLPDFHAAYVRTYIERDARLLADVSDWQQFGRFFRLTAAMTSQETNYSHLGRELGLHPETSRRWLDILKATFQWHEIPSYSGNVLKRVSNKPKGYFADTGVACHAQAISSPHAIPSHPLWGALFETAVVGEIRKSCSLLSPRPNLYHWRSHGGAEVDLLLERDGILYPIEIKATSTPTRGDTSGIAAFRKTYPRLRIETGLVLAPTEKVLALTEYDFAVPWDVGP